MITNFKLKRQKMAVNPPKLARVKFL